MPRRKQLHIWLSDGDHEFLTRYARQRDETIGVIVRRLVRHLKQPHRPMSASPTLDDEQLHTQGVLISDD